MSAKPETACPMNMLEKSGNVAMTQTSRRAKSARMRSASALYDWYLLEKEANEFHFRVGQVFDPATKEFKVRDIMLVKQLHCWEMKYTYSDYRNINLGHSK